jgi:hypothetical protein
VNAHRLFLLLTALLLIGCFGRPQPPPGAPEADAARSADGAETMGRPAAPAPRTPVDLHEAMARAVFHHLPDRISRMTRALSAPFPSALRYERLPEAARSAGYGDYRGPTNAPGEVDPAPQLAELWDVLDLGLTHAFREGGGLPAELIREKSLQNLLADVRYAYYRAAAAQALEARGAAALRRADAVVREAGQAADPVAHHALYERMRRLQRALQELGTAPAELAVLMGLPPGVDFQVARVRWKEGERGNSTMSEAGGTPGLGLRFRAEAAAAAADPGRRAREARAGLARLAGSGRPPADPREWWRAGARLAIHLFGPPTSDGARTRDMAILTQTRVALERYRIADRAYQDARDLAHAARERSAQSAGSLDSIDRAIEAHLAGARQYLTFGDRQNARARVYHSLGLDPLPTQTDAMRIPELARALERSIRRWPDQLNQALAARAPDSRLPRRREAAGPPAREARAEGSAPAPPEPARSDVDDPRPRSETAPESAISADSARREGRAAAREISVFRDVVRIRSGPSPAAPVIGQGLIGERYPLLGWSKKGWLEIEMSDGTSGWIPTRYVRPVAAAASGRSQGDSSGDPMAVVTTTRANVRFGAGLKFKVRYTEEEGVRMPVIDTNSDWFKVRAPDGEVGWLHQSVVRVAGGGA